MRAVIATHGRCCAASRAVRSAREPPGSLRDSQCMRRRSGTRSEIPVRRSAALRCSTSRRRAAGHWWTGCFAASSSPFASSLLAVVWVCVRGRCCGIRRARLRRPQLPRCRTAAAHGAQPARVTAVVRLLRRSIEDGIPACLFNADVAGASSAMRGLSFVRVEPCSTCCLGQTASELKLLQ